MTDPTHYPEDDDISLLDLLHTITENLRLLVIGRTGRRPRLAVFRLHPPSTAQRQPRRRIRSKTQRHPNCMAQSPG